MMRNSMLFLAMYVHVPYDRVVNSFSRGDREQK